VGTLPGHQKVISRRFNIEIAGPAGYRFNHLDPGDPAVVPDPEKGDAAGFTPGGGIKVFPARMHAYGSRVTGAGMGLFQGGDGLQER
jgi:hypothetical protein